VEFVLLPVHLIYQLWFVHCRIWVWLTSRTLPRPVSRFQGPRDPSRLPLLWHRDLLLELFDCWFGFGNGSRSDINCCILWSKHFGCC
jgi:hypothetical protein